MSAESTLTTGDKLIWRLVEFYIIVPWPIAWPEDRVFMKSRPERLDWMPVPLKTLETVLPTEIARHVLALGDRNFTAFQFIRYPIEHVSPTERFSAVMKLAESATSPPQLRSLFGDPINGEQSATRIKTYQTIIKAATCLLDEPNNLQLAFDRCLEEFADFMESYVQTVGDLRAGFVSRSTVYPLVPAVRFDPMSGRKEETGIRAGDNFWLSPAEPEELTPEQIQEIAARFELAIRGEPYITIRQWQRVAHRAFHLDGDYAAAVVAAHTAGETYFDALLLRLGWEEIKFKGSCSTTREEVFKWFSYPETLKTRLNRFYHPRLDGGWDSGTPGNPIHTWIVKVSKLRNKVVHGGYRPTEEEARQALVSLAEVEAFVEALISQLPNVQRYPFSIFMMLGPVGLERKGVYTKKTRATIESAPAGWRQSFYEFRQSIIEDLP